MIYFVYNRLLRITLRVFFKHIHVSNVENIPNNKPIIIAANHPGAFLDPILIACALHRPVSFLVRGDVFKSKLICTIFSWFRMYPVYRKDEGYENIEKNHDTHDKVTEILKRNGIVVVFCEGYSASNRRLRTILKGTARMGMQTAMVENKDVLIVPAGITYSHKTNFRKSALLDFSKPIAVKDFENEYLQHPQKAFVGITAELERRLHDHFVEIKREECDLVTELNLNYYRNIENLSPLPVYISNTKKLDAERSISEKINDLFETDSSQYKDFERSNRHYQEALKEYQCDDLGVVSKGPGLVELIFLVLGIPFFILGVLYWGVPYLIAKNIADKRVTRVDFHDSLMVNIITILFACFIGISVLVSSCFVGLYGFLIAFLLPVIGVFSGWYYDTLLRIYFVFKAFKHKEILLGMRKKLEQYLP